MSWQLLLHFVVVSDIALQNSPFCEGKQIRLLSIPRVPDTNLEFWLAHEIEPNRIDSYNSVRTVIMEFSDLYTNVQLLGYLIFKG